MPESTVFGQALDLRIPLLLEAPESLPPSCLSAEVSVGEQRLPATAVQLTIERGGHDGSDSRVRLRSTVAVLEPLVSVKLTAGCNAPVSRQFVVFADPPVLRADAARAPAVEAATVLPATAPVRQGAPTRAASSIAETSKTAAAPRTSRKAVRAPSRSTSAAATTQPRIQAAAPSTKPRGALSAVPEKRIARLQLEEPEVLLKAAAAALAAQDVVLAAAEQSARAAQAAASAAEGHLVALEKDLQTLRADATANRAAMDEMRTRLAQSEVQGRWTWALAVLLAVLAVVALWLGMRLRAKQHARQSRWWQDAQADTAAADDVQGTGSNPPVASEAALPVAAPMVAASPVSTGLIRPVHADQAQAALTRAVSVDELIDLEQQAEFFAVLGDERAAVELLMAHLRGSGGVSPLPYLKLLEIYRRREDREAYERMRKRFHHRFDSVAPDWDDELERGRGLQDYPAVLADLQASWHAPTDAMVELEGLLFRKRNGALFELPAYRDVLTLYAVARDLHRHAELPASGVDLLLPLGAAHGPDATARRSIFDPLEARDSSAARLVEEGATAPIDLDLSQFDDGRPDSRPGDLLPLSVSPRRDH